MNTAEARTVVHNPSLCPWADWVTLEVVMNFPLALYCFSLSSQSLLESNSMPSVVASIVAAKSSA